VTRLALLALALVLAGCGGDARGAGTATLWVTRDRGQHVLYEGTVPAGLTAMQALDRKLDIETRYGGRFVEAIGGIHGNAAKQRDWFWYVNGIEGDRSAGEYRLRDGDVEWWDYRSWKRQMRVPVVVGAFPEPFLHGYDGIDRGAIVVGGDDETAEQLAEAVGGSILHGPGAVDVRNVIAIRRNLPANAAYAERDAHAVRLILGVRAADRLAHDPSVLRFRYEVRR